MDNLLAWVRDVQGMLRARTALSKSSRLILVIDGRWFVLCGYPVRVSSRGEAGRAVVVRCIRRMGRAAQVKPIERR
ncbi:hypothetical protein L686_08325 [Stutzerimonas stutzeri MF28]|uniref:Uncharacterized protein n=1 Tax=Stutzerimonas stutzeri TaxID=316 RepID=A0A2N8SVK8_STUST|nr:hypothetical protein L686_08325 [Stutzerimonas stutzeri MF28]PNG06533.1 hypothetical protein CXL00_06250 [Stutzerimonas stutzeri]